MWNIKAIFIVLLFLLSSFYFPAEYNNLKDDPTGQDVIVDENNIKDAEVTSDSSSSSESRALSSNLHGGSWEDSFEDDTGIDWGMCDHLKMQTGDVAINITPSIDPDIIAQWHFDEGTGTAFYDSTPNNLDGTIYGATWVTGMYDKALSFDGINDHARVLHNSKLVMGTGAFTVSAWVKIDSSETSYQYFISKGDTGGIGNPSNDYHLGLEGNNGKAMFSISDASKNSYSVYGNADLRDDTWHFVAGTRNGNTVKVYVDGSLKNTLTNSNIANCNVGGNGPFAFSYAVDHDPNYDLHGLLDEVTLYSTALTDTQITDKYVNKTYSRIRYGNMTSNVINLPAEMYWDTILIDKTQAANNYLNVTILDASNDQPVPGTPAYIAGGEFDISFIDPVQYPSIKLNATLEGDGSTTPKLHYWGVSWNASNTWQDTLFGGWKVESILDAEAVDGNVKLAGGIDPSAVGIWHFDEGLGATVYDETDNDNDGTIFGASWTSGKYNDALNFDGTFDRVEVPDSPSLYLPNGFTITLWIKDGGSSGATALACKRTNSVGGLEWSFIGITGTPRTRLTIYDDSQSSYIGRENSNLNIFDGNWHFIAGTWDGGTSSSNVKIYIDGLNVDDTDVKSGSFLGMEDKSTDIYLGDTQEISVNKYKGVMDEVGIYSRALTVQEIGALYTNVPNSYDNGVMISKSLVIPENIHWDTLIINKTEPSDTFLNVTVLDADTDLPISGFENLVGTTIDISSINSVQHNSIKLKADLISNGIDTPILHDWSVNWTKNTAPRVLDITGPPQVYRNNSIRLTANLTDKEDLESELTFNVKYRTPLYVSWQTSYLTTPVYTTDHWEFNFTPPKDAETGDYTFEISCKDSFDIEHIYPEPFIIEVLNNIPSQPEVDISPAVPRTGDDLEVSIISAEDVETPEDQLEFWYRWYKDDLSINELDNLSKVSSSNTAKGQEWRCEVLSFDDEDISPPGLAEVTIKNSAPELTGAFDEIMMEEDVPLELENEVSWLFADPDSDELTYEAEGQVNLVIDIIQETGLVTLTPKPNWNGMESITFIANDTEAQVEAIVEFTVYPTNDLPVIKQVGSQLVSDEYSELEFVVSQDDWINLTVISEDIDGDDKRGTLYYILNIPERENLFFDNDKNELVFNPKNADVGWHYIEIKVTDNNETPVEYTSQKLKIQVINVNDPPSVQITEPEDGIKISQDFKLSFNCTADDIDLLIPNSTEKLTYRWYARTPEVIELGTGKELVNPKLPVGQFSITVEVKDSDNAVATDSILVNVAKAKTDTTKVTSSVFFWIVIIIIIVVILVTIFLIARKRRRKDEVVHPEVVSTESLPSPYTGAPMGPAPAHEAVPAAEPQAAVSAQARTELPLTTSPVTTYSLTAEPQAGETAEPTPQEKLKMLENRLLKGEIDQDTYRELKAKIEMEIPEPQPVPTPQLPAAVTPEPEVSVQPAVTPQVDQPTVDQPTQDAYPTHLELPVQEGEPTPVVAPAVPEQPPQEQVPQPVQQPLCTTCGQPMSFVEQYNNYYCYQCQKYA
jgi:hypothetical protein